MSCTDYTVQGENWGELCATGQHQSPIDIEPLYANSESNSNPFMPVNYDRSNTWDVVLGCGIIMTPNADDITLVFFKSSIFNLTNNALD